MTRAETQAARVNDRLADRLAIGVLMSAFPGEAVEEVIDKTNCREKRTRDLPARLMIYYVLTLCLYTDLSYLKVMRLLATGLGWLSGDMPDPTAASVAGIARARARLGEEPLRLLFHRVAGPLAAYALRPPFWRGLRAVSLDAVTFEVPSTQANARSFGPLGDDDRASSVPAARVITLGEWVTGGLLGAAVTAKRRPTELDLLTALDSTMLLFAHGRFDGDALWPGIVASGAHVVWEVASPPASQVLHKLPDGSYVSAFTPAEGRHDAAIRVIECQLAHPGASAARPLTLITTLMDPDDAPAAELVALHARRWRARRILRSLNACPQPRNIVLRSKSPDMVRQEIWAMLCVYQALRAMMWQAAGEPVIPAGERSWLRTRMAPAPVLTPLFPDSRK